VRTVLHQLVPSAVPGDATTSHTLQLKSLLEDLGFDSEVFALAVHRQLESKVKLIQELRGPSRADSFLIYQCSAHSELADWLIGRREQIALNYHNVTPHEYFLRYDRAIASSLRDAELQVEQLARVARTGICDSEFNAKDLRGRGFSDTPVSPILLDLNEFDTEPDPGTRARIEQRRSSGELQFLCVGGLAPHKAQHDLVMAFWLYRRLYGPKARLSLVGRTMSKGYGSALERLVGELGLGDWVDITGGVTHEELVAHYRSSDVLVSASEHEGFCVPLVEAMYNGLPVVAYDAGAVGDTLGAAGVLLTDKSPCTLAGAIWRVCSDVSLREHLGRAARSRITHFSLGRTRAQMEDTIRAWMGSSQRRRVAR
jgi:glycosyltransferase involved in cell wall biosynthesis